MIPIQDVEFQTDKNVFYKLHLVAHNGEAPFLIELFIYDSKFVSPFQPEKLSDRRFNDAKDAFAHALQWVTRYNAEHGYNLSSINNPCNCEFLSQQEQQAIVNAADLTLNVQVNGA